MLVHDREACASPNLIGSAMRRCANRSLTGMKLLAPVLIGVGLVGSVAIIILGLIVSDSVRGGPIVFWVFGGLVVFLIWWDIAFHLRHMRAHGTRRSS